MATDRNKLVNRRHSTDNDVIVDRHVAAQIDCIGKDNMLTEDAVVSNMDVRHQGAIASDNCLPPVLRPSIQSRKFTYRGTVTNFECRFLTMKFQVLGDGSQDRTRINFALLSDPSPPRYHGVGTDGRAITDGDVFLNDCERADRNIFAQFRPWTDY